MTIANVKATADPVHHVHAVLNRLGPWAEVLENGTRRAFKDIPDNLFADRRMIYIRSISQYRRLFTALSNSDSTHWCVVVRCGEREAAYNCLPYADGLSVQHALDLVTTEYPVTLQLKTDKIMTVRQVLPAVITELYKIPRPERPFKEVFSVICGATTVMSKTWPPDLTSAVVKAAELIAPIIQGVSDPQNREEIRANALKHSLDPFEINFAYAKYVQDYSKSPARGRPSNAEMERRRLVREKEDRAKERAAQKAMPHKFQRPDQGSTTAAPKGNQGPEAAKGKEAKQGPSKGKAGKGKAGVPRIRTTLFAFTASTTA